MKTAKRLLTLALALCMLIGIPFAVSAADAPFEIREVLEAPVGYDWDSVTWYTSAIADTADYKDKWLGKTVFVTFSDQLSDDAITNLQNGTTKFEVTKIGGTGSQALRGTYLGHINKQTVVFAHSGAGYTAPAGPSGNATYRTFDYIRGTQGNAGCYFVITLAGADANGDNLVEELTSINDVGLTKKSTWRITERTPLRITGVTPLADSQAKQSLDKGITWLIQFNQSIRHEILTETGVIRIAVMGENGARVDGLDDRCNIVSEYCTDTVLAVRMSNPGRTISYYEDLAVTKGTTVSGYGFEFDDMVTNKKNNCIDMLISTSGEALPCTASIDTFSWDTMTTTYSKDKWASDFYGLVGAKVGDTPYKTFAQAMEAAKAANTATTVTLCNDAVVSDRFFELDSHITLNLNGYEFATDNYMIVFGEIVDSSDGLGKLAIDAEKIFNLTAADDILPLYDTNGYRFYNYEFRHVEKADIDTNVVQYSVGLGFNNKKAYEVLVASNMDFGVEMTISGESKKIIWVFSDELMQDFAEKNAEKRTAITVTISGLDTLGEANFTSKAILKSENLVVNLAKEFVME